MMEQDAAPAGVGITHPRTRAAPGFRSGAIRPPREELADGGPCGLLRLDGAAAQKGPRLRAEGGTKRNVGSAARRRMDVAMARREAPRTGNGACYYRMTRPSARHPLIFRGAESLS